MNIKQADLNPKTYTRVLVQNPILAPYRLAFFDQLSKSSMFDVTYAYGQAQHGTALQSVMQPEGLCVKHLQNLFISPHPILTIQRGLVEYLRENDNHVVIATLDPRILTNFLAYRTARRRGMKWIWWGHGVRPRGRFQTIYRAMAMKGDAVILYNGPAAEKLAALGVPREKLFVAWNSIDTEEINQLADINSATRRHRVLYIGRLIAEKKVDLLVRGFAEALPGLGADTMLTIIGDGPERQRLEMLAQSYGIGERIEFPGGMYAQIDLAPYFNTSWVSVSPGYIGLSAIHSLAYGVPMLVADNEPHSPEIVAIEEGVNSLYFDANNSHDLAERLKEMDRDRALLTSMGQSGRDTVARQFSVGAMVNSFEMAIAYAMRDQVKARRV